jgi:hypothetical protein
LQTEEPSGAKCKVNRLSENAENPNKWETNAGGGSVSEVGKVIGDNRRFNIIWKKSLKVEDRNLYCKAKKEAKRAVYVAQSKEQKAFGQMLDLDKRVLCREY